MLRRTPRETWIWIAAMAAGLSFADPTHAYCLARSCDPDAKDGDQCQVDAETHCSIEGLELRRSSGCITIAIRKGTAAAVPGLSDAELEQIVLEGFEMWTSLPCEGGHPAIRVQSAGIVETDDKFACREVPDQNVDLWMVSDDVSPTQVVTPTTGTVAGVTFPTFLLGSGEVFDADVKINTLWALVQDEENLHDVLRVAVAHEAGHVLGLSHSQLEDALMFKHYPVTVDRAPTADDRAGICELFPPGDLDCDEPSAPAAALNQTACTRAFRLQQQQQPNGEGNPPESSDCELNVAAPSRGNLSTATTLLFVLAALGRWRARRSR